MNKIKLRIKIFESIRDIPYRIGRQENDTSCRAKSKILGDLLTRTGLKCQTVRGISQWSELGLPINILDLIKRPIFNHFFVRVYIPENKNWVNVDATWDIGLQRKFRISRWNGLSDTPLACQVTKIEKLKPFDLSFRDFNPKDDFTKLLNNWFSNIRSKND